MGKRKKKVDLKLSDQELVPSTIGYLEEDKSGPFGVVILFTIFIVVAIFLPNITDYVNKLLGKDTIDTPVVVNEDKDTKTEEKKTEDVMHNLTDDLEFTYNGLKFSNISLSSSMIMNVTVENTTDENISNTASKYFIETYDDSSTMLGRHMFEAKSFVKKQSDVYSFEISSLEYTNTSKILITTKSSDDYPNFELINNTLTCSNGEEEIIYTYSNDKIVNIKDTLEFTSDGTSNYDTAILLYTKIATNYNNLEGVSSNVIEVSSGFTMTTDIDVTKANINSLENSNYYSSNTDSKIVNFEMETRGYSCK